MALPHAEELARLTCSPIHLVRVIDVTRVRRFGPVGLAVEHTAFEQMLAAEESASPEYLAKVERDINSRGLTATQQILRGSVRHELIAVTRPDDLIVMASHGRGGIPRWFMGSVAEDVLRHATVPIMLIRPEKETVEVEIAADEARSKCHSS